MQSRIYEVYPDGQHFLEDARLFIKQFFFSYSRLNRREFNLTAPGHTAVLRGRHQAFRKLSRIGLERQGYETPTIALMSFILSTFKVDTMYDVGASVGYYAAMAASLSGKSVTAHAFEMRRDRFHELMETAKQNDVISGKIIPHRAGLSDRHEGTRDIWFSRTQMFEEKPPVSAYREAWHRRLKFALGGIRDRDQLFQEPVLLTSIDALVETTGSPEFIKIDVDGYEGKILAGATACIAKYRPFILLELHKDELIGRTGWSRLSIANSLLQAGYCAAHLSNHDNYRQSRLVDVTAEQSIFERQTTMHFLFY